MYIMMFYLEINIQDAAIITYLNIKKNSHGPRDKREF